jgi:hypothetical protein
MALEPPPVWRAGVSESFHLPRALPGVTRASKWYVLLLVFALWEGYGAAEQAAAQETATILATALVAILTRRCAT